MCLKIQHLNPASGRFGSPGFKDLLAQRSLIPGQEDPGGQNDDLTRRYQPKRGHFGQLCAHLIYKQPIHSQLFLPPFTVVVFLFLPLPFPLPPPPKTPLAIIN